MASSDQRSTLADIAGAVGHIPDFPKKGIVFRDIFPVLRDHRLFASLIDVLVEYLESKHQQIDVIVGLDARGFLFGPIIAQRLKCSFVPIRKKGKLPGECLGVSYQLEYGVDTFEIQKSAIKDGQNVIIVDDLLATGGTMSAACKLVEKVSGKVLECIVVIELTHLEGRKKVEKPLYSMLQYASDD